MGAEHLSWLLLTGFAGAAGILVMTAMMILRSKADPIPAVLPAVANAKRASTGGARPRWTPLQKQLAEAGFDHPWAVQGYYLVKILATVLSTIMGIAVAALDPFGALPLLQRAVLIAAIGLLGYFLPTMFVDRRRLAWRKRIENAVPDALDFMLVCVEAGQSIDMAASRVAFELETVHPDLALRFADLTKALAAGASREEAFLHLAQVTESNDLRQYATLVIQSSTLGTPMAQSLRVFSADLRDRRIRLVEERANVLPTKMTLATMMFTVPPLLVLLMTPAVYRLITAL